MKLVRLGIQVASAPQARFLIAGSFASLINWLVRFPLELVLPFAAAVLVATVIGMSCGFVLYDQWVFRGSRRLLRQKIQNFIAVNFAIQSVIFVTSVGTRELLVIADWGTTFAGAAAHLFGIANGAIISFLGHRIDYVRSWHEVGDSARIALR